MADKQEVLDALLEKIQSNMGNAGAVLKWAEAYAWLASPAQPHGTSS